MNESTFDFEIVIVGGGPAGLAAACAASESGISVGVLDDTPWLGGQIWRGQEPHPCTPEAKSWLTRFRKSRAILLRGASVVAAGGPGLLLVEHNQRPCRVRWQHLILATGARELFLPFPGWTLPGIMGPGGLLALAKHGWPINGRRIVVAGTGPLLLAAAEGLRHYGAHVMAIAEQAPWRRVMAFGLSLAGHHKLWQGVRLKVGLLGVPHCCSTWVTRAEGDGQLRSVTLTNGSRSWRQECDFLACGFGLVPNVELPLALGCELRNGCVRVDDSQATTVPNVYCAGEPTGIAGADSALVQGMVAGYSAANQPAKAQALFARRNSWHAFGDALANSFALRPELKSLATDDTVLCRCEDVTLGRARQFSSWRDAKLQSRCGMGTCQGRVCGAAAKVILGWQMESVRPPVLPALVGSLISQPHTQNPDPNPGAGQEHSQVARVKPIEDNPKLYARA
jgi:NADPH-dependent 2,4-dienoyl-CoA reductase/sulfur reductase-like enzyme